MDTTLKLLKASDMMSLRVENTIEHSSRIKNWFGGLMTLVLVVVLIVFGIVFGKELIARENPFTSTVKRVFEDSPVDLTEFPLAFSFIDSFGNDLSQNEDFMASLYMSAQLWEIHPLNVSSTTTRVKYPIVECTSEIMPEEELSMIKTVAGQRKMFCFDFSKGTINKEPASSAPLVRNEYAESDSAFFYFFVSRCKRKGILCNEFKASNDVFYIKMFSRGKYLDFQDLSSPTKKIVDSRTVPVSYSLSKRDFIDIDIGKLVSDEGWLFQEETSETWYQLGNITQTVDIQSEDNTLMYGFTFSSPKLRTVNYRRYTKVQEWMAQMGGFLKGLSLVLRAICIPFSNYSFYRRMRSKVCRSKPQLVNNYTDCTASSKIPTNHKKTKTLKFNLNLMQFFTRFWKIKESPQFREISNFLEITYISDKMIFLENELEKLKKEETK